MRFTSLIVELIRARPYLVFWLASLALALIWVIVPLVVYAGPPDGVASVLAFGREYRMGTALGPPLAYWLADIAYRAAGSHIVGVYVLAQICSVVTFWAVFMLGRAIVGGPHAALAVLLTVTVLSFSYPGVAFGPQILAQPLWALALLYAWRVFGQGRRNAWFALSIVAGLLLLTTTSATLLLVLLLVFALATERGRRALASIDPVLALIVIAVLAGPYVVWLVRAQMFVLPPAPSPDLLQARIAGWSRDVALMLLGLAGIAILVVLNLTLRRDRDPPAITRHAVTSEGRLFVAFFALAPPFLFSLPGALFADTRYSVGTGTMLALSGLAVILFSGDIIHLRRQRMLRAVWAALIAAPVAWVMLLALGQPLTSGSYLTTSLPARDISRFFADSFERRTGRPLPAVAGDPQLAALVALAAPARPHLFLDASPQLTPWQSAERFSQTGGVVVWYAADTGGAPPEEIARRFPGLVPELPHSFSRLLQGRQPPLRVGWSIIRPKNP